MCAWGAAAATAATFANERTGGDLVAVGALPPVFRSKC